MTPPVWVSELARVLPSPPRFPRDLRSELSFGPLNVVVAVLPGLTVTKVREYLNRCGLTTGMPGEELRLRGCVFAWRGEAILFISTEDPEDEQRFTLAHELSHFLRHYRQPRERCSALMAPGILGVLDGDRPATPSEAIHAALRGIPLGPHVQLFDRTMAHGVEDEADRLACELLAPASEVRNRLAADTDINDVERELTTTFGLPPLIAAAYARQLVTPVPKARDWLQFLKNNVENPSNT